MGYQKNIVKSKIENDNIKSFFDLNPPEKSEKLFERLLNKLKFYKQWKS